MGSFNTDWNMMNRQLSIPKKVELAQRAIFKHLKAKGSISANESFESFMSVREQDKESFAQFNELIEVVIREFT